MREINFFKTTSGKSPVEDFLNSLSSRQTQKISWVLELIEEGTFVPKQYFKN